MKNDIKEKNIIWELEDFIFLNTTILGFSDKGRKKALSGVYSLVLPGVTNEGLPVEHIASFAFNYIKPNYTYDINNMKLSLNPDFIYYSHKFSDIILTNCYALKTIGDYAFYGCESSSVVFDEYSEIIEIGEYAFSGNNIEELNLSNLAKLQYIKKEAFSNNKINIIDFTKCSNLASFGERAFASNNIFVLNSFPDVKISLPASLFEDNVNSLDNNIYILKKLKSKTPKLVGVNKQKCIVNPSFSLNIADNYLSAKERSTLLMVSSIGKDETASHSFKKSNNKSMKIELEINDINEDFILSVKSSNKARQEKLKINALDIISRIHKNNSFEVMENLISLKDCYIKSDFNIKNSTVKGPSSKSIFNNKTLSELYFPLSLSNDIEIIGVGAFRDYSFQSLSFKNLPNLKTISENAFSNNEINNINLSNLLKLEEINANAFSDNKISNLTLHNLPNLKSIHNKAFKNNNISSFNFTNIPNIVTLKDLNINTDNLKSCLIIDCENLKYPIKDLSLNKDTEYIIFLNCKNLKEYYIKNCLDIYKNKLIINNCPYLSK